MKVFVGSDVESSEYLKMVGGSPGKNDYSAVVGAEHLDPETVDNNGSDDSESGIATDPDEAIMIAPHSATRS